MKVTIIGTGYVGLVSGACLADLGNDVLCLDVDQAKIDRLNSGEIPIYEPGLESLVRHNAQAGRLRFTTDVEASVGHGQFQLIAVGTPPDEDGSADLRYVLAAARNVGRHMTEYRIIVDKSTVPVGTADLVREAIAAVLAERGADVPFNVVSNPEFLKEGAAVEDFMKPDRIIVGTDDERAAQLMRALYAPLQRNHERMLIMDVRSAELTKYAANAMLATRISFMNELANLAERLGANIEQVRRGMGSDPRIGYHFLYAGAGYGGSCFPKDVRALQRTADQGGAHLRILKAVEEANEAQKVVLLREARDAAGCRSRRQALRALGAGVQAEYRRHARGAQPGADRRRSGAPAARWSPTTRPRWRKRSASTAPSRACLSANLRSLAWTAPMRWSSSPSGKSFAAPISPRSSGALRQPLMFDGRNLYDPAVVQAAGLEYYSIGRA